MELLENAKKFTFKKVAKLWLEEKLLNHQPADATLALYDYARKFLTLFILILETWKEIQECVTHNNVASYYVLNV